MSLKKKWLMKFLPHCCEVSDCTRSSGSRPLNTEHLSWPRAAQLAVEAAAEITHRVGHHTDVMTPNVPSGSVIPKSEFIA